MFELKINNNLVRLCLGVILILVGCDKSVEILKGDYFNEGSCVGINITKNVMINYRYGIDSINSLWEKYRDDGDGRCIVKVILSDYDERAHIISTISPSFGKALLREEIFDAIDKDNIFAHNLSFSITLPLRENAQDSPVNYTFHVREVRDRPSINKNKLYCKILEDSLAFDTKYPSKYRNRVNVEKYSVYLSKNNVCVVEADKVAKYDNEPNLKSFAERLYKSPKQLHHIWDGGNYTYDANITFNFSSNGETYTAVYDSIDYRKKQSLKMQLNRPPGRPQTH